MLRAVPLHVPVAPRPVERPAHGRTDSRSFPLEAVPHPAVPELNVPDFGVLGRGFQNAGVVALPTRSRVKVRFAKPYPVALLRHHDGLKGRPVAVLLIRLHAPVLP